MKTKPVIQEIKRRHRAYNTYTEDQVFGFIVSVLKKHNYEYYFNHESIFLKIPDFICTNAYGNSTEVTGLFIELRIKGKIIRGRRFSYTPEHYDSRYNHSHLPWGPLEFTTFCFGAETDARAYLFQEKDRIGLPNKFEYIKFHERLDWFLYYLPVYLAEESTFTNPYNQISNIKFPGLRVNNESLDYGKVFSYLKSVNLKLTNKNGLPYISVELNNIDKQLEKDGYTVYIDNQTGQEYSNINLDYFPARKFNDDCAKHSFQFRQEKLLPKLIPTKLTEDQFNKTVSIRIKKKIINYYEKKFNDSNFINSFSRAAAESRIDNRGHVSEENTISLF